MEELNLDACNWRLFLSFGYTKLDGLPIFSLFMSRSLRHYIVDVAYLGAVFMTGQTLFLYRGPLCFLHSATITVGLAFARQQKHIIEMDFHLECAHAR